MTGQEDSLTQGSQPFNKLANLKHACRVESIGWLIQEHKLRVGEQRCRNTQALFHTERVFPISHFRLCIQFNQF